MLTVYILFLLGLILIIKGGDWFVDASAWIAKITGVPSFIIGATIVSLATTLPELIVSVNATMQGSPGVAIGNAIGSTICNIGLISGLSIVAMPGFVNRKVFAKKSSVMIGGTLIFLGLTLDGILTKPEALVLFALLGLFVYFNLTEFKNKDAFVDEEVDKSQRSYIIHGLKFVVGAFCIIQGASLLVDNGILIARHLNVPESIIALSFIALGTSLPELVTTVSAIVKRDHEIGLGNIVGANILNITMILSTSAFVSKGGLVVSQSNFSFFGMDFVNQMQTLVVDLPISLVLMAILTIPSIVRGKLSKYQGYGLMAVYVFYLSILASIAL